MLLGCILPLGIYNPRSLELDHLKALELAERLEPSATNIARVAKQTSHAAAAWAFTQWELRRRARTKFSNADHMLFTREALEQATHEHVAAYHASKFPKGALVADLTCGIGGDLMALASRGPAIGYELDAERAAYARHNVRSATVIETDSLTDDWTWDYAIADPSRRVAGRRTLNHEDFQPDVRELAKRMQKLRLGCIKLSPLLKDSFLESLGKRLEFVSFRGECREALVWCGSETEPGRVAVQVESGETLPAGEGATHEEDPKGWMFEADPAAIRSHSLGTLCDRHGLSLLGDSNGYLTGDTRLDSPWLRSYRVMATDRAGEKSIRMWLRELNARVVEVKSRVKGLDLIKWQKNLRTTEGRPVTVAFYPVGLSVRFVLLEPITSDLMPK